MKQYRIEDESLSRAFKYLKPTLRPKDVRPLCRYLIHDGNGTWVATDGHRLHEWRSKDCKWIGEWGKSRHADIGEGQYKIIKLLKKSAVIELVNGTLSDVKGTRHIFKLTDPGYKTTKNIDVTQLPFPSKPYEAAVNVYRLIGELYMDDNLRDLRTFNIDFLTDALQYGCKEVLLGCDHFSDHLYIKTSETTAVIMPIRTRRKHG